jgi:hypothetical protein
VPAATLVTGALLAGIGLASSTVGAATATVSPATVSPATVSPATVSPATVSPATVSPATVSPATVSPAAEAPETAPAPIELDGALLEGRTEVRRERPEGGDVHLNGLVLVHFGDGLGAGGQLRIDGFGLRATLGYEPLLFLVDDDPQDQTFGAVEFSHSAQLNLDSLLLASKSEIGASLGYRYNTLLGHGVAVAFQSMFDLWRQRFAFSIPVMYFPDGTERVRDEYGLSRDYEINFPFGAGIQYGIGVAWLL